MPTELNHRRSVYICLHGFLSFLVGTAGTKPVILALYLVIASIHFNMKLPTNINNFYEVLKWAQMDSNHRPPLYKSGALPLSYAPTKTLL